MSALLGPRLNTTSRQPNTCVRPPTHHEQGDHPAAAEHALLAHGHTVQAISHADDAAILHANVKRSTAHSHG